jgi:hypothetical protein
MTKNKLSEGIILGFAIFGLLVIISLLHIAISNETIEILSIEYAPQPDPLTWHVTATEKASTTTSFSIYSDIYPCSPGGCCDKVYNLSDGGYLCANFRDIPIEVTAYCDGMPKECNERYSIMRHICFDVCENSDGTLYNCVYNCPEYGESFQCVEWNNTKDATGKCHSYCAVPYCDVIKVPDKDSSCTRSALIFNGSCEDAIKVYGGVCR